MHRTAGRPMYNCRVIRWQDLDPARVERAVQALLRRLHPDAVAIDGSGGDDGQDTAWRSPDGLVIFEVKSHTARLTSSQKRNILRSLTRAVTHQPVRWCLILPLNPSPAEQSWFERLGERFAPVTLEWRGRDWLDEQFARHDDLRRAVEGTDYALLQRARELGLEQAAIGSLDDLLNRQRALSARGLELSPHWRADITSRSGEALVTFAERYPGAALIDPVNIKSVFVFPEQDETARQIAENLRHVLDYGGDITVPGEYVERFDVESSEESRHLWGSLGLPGALRITSIEDNTYLPLVCQLALTDGQSRLKRSLDISLIRRIRGARGVTLEGSDVSGFLRVRLRLGHDGDQTVGSLDFFHGPLVGLLPHAVEGALQLFRPAEPGDRLELRFGPIRAAYALIDPEAVRDLYPLADLVAALVVIQQHTNQLIPIPLEFTQHDLIDLRAAAEALQGGRGRLRSRQVTATIRAGHVSDFIRMLRQQDYHGALYVVYEEMGIRFANHAISLGLMAMYGPRMRLANLEDLRAAGPVDEPTARFTCTEDEALYMMRPVEDPATETAS
jgi:hypothetical protein